MTAATGLRPSELCGLRVGRLNLLTGTLEVAEAVTVERGHLEVGPTLIQLDAHPKAIQERLGHSSITVTMDVYGHLFPSVVEALTERLDEVFRAARLAPDAEPASVTSIL